MKHLFMSFAVCLIVATCFILIACSDLCKDVDCGNGTCDEADGKCNCAIGYETSASMKCDSLSIAKFIGNYDVHDVCTSGTYDYNLSIVSSSTSIDKVVIQNYGNYQTGATLFETVATVTLNTINIPAATYVFNNHTYQIYNASATMMPDSTFTLTYKIGVDGVLQSDCVAVYAKQ